MNKIRKVYLNALMIFSTKITTISTPIKPKKPLLIKIKRYLDWSMSSKSSKLQFFCWR